MRRLTIIGATALLTGCAAVSKDLVATGGSRADGTIELSYEVAQFERVELSPAQGLAAATARCQAWGYASAEAFGGERRQCQAPGQYGCMQWLVTVPYQCTGSGPA